jgi:glycosyltransferase involved in cell wall biosynthesis
VIHIKAGDISYIRKEELLPYMEEFRINMISFIREHELEYELIHANFWMSALVAMELKKEISIPYVITFHALGKIRKLHQQDADKFPPERIEIEEVVAHCADRVIAECPQDMHDLKTHYNIPEDKMTIVPCGYNPTEFFPVDKIFARTLLRLDQDEFILLQLGRMVPRKGVDNAIRALPFLKNMKKKVRLLVVGGESDDPDPGACPEIGRMMKLAAEEGVSNMVHFTGRKNRNLLKYYFSAADVFITTPWYEPFGITPLESMACGTPVIGSNVGGIQFSVEDGNTGLLVPPKDPEALAEKIKLLLTNPLLIRKMRTRSIMRVQNLFTWQKIAEAMDDVYEQVIHGDIRRISAPVIQMNTGSDGILYSEG